MDRRFTKTLIALLAASLLAQGACSDDSDKGGADQGDSDVSDTDTSGGDDASSGDGDDASSDDDGSAADDANDDDDGSSDDDDDGSSDDDADDGDDDGSSDDDADDGDTDDSDPATTTDVIVDDINELQLSPVQIPQINNDGAYGHAQVSWVAGGDDSPARVAVYSNPSDEGSYRLFQSELIDADVQAGDVFTLSATLDANLEDDRDAPLWFAVGFATEYSGGTGWVVALSDPVDFSSGEPVDIEVNHALTEWEAGRGGENPTQLRVFGVLVSTANGAQVIFDDFEITRTRGHQPPALDAFPINSSFESPVVAEGYRLRGAYGWHNFGTGTSRGVARPSADAVDAPQNGEQAYAMVGRSGVRIVSEAISLAADVPYVVSVTAACHRSMGCPESRDFELVNAGDLFTVSGTLTDFEAPAGEWAETTLCYTSGQNRTVRLRASLGGHGHSDEAPVYLDSFTIRRAEEGECDDE